MWLVLGLWSRHRTADYNAVVGLWSLVPSAYVYTPSAGQAMYTRAGCLLIAHDRKNLANGHQLAQHLLRLTRNEYKFHALGYRRNQFAQLSLLVVGPSTLIVTLMYVLVRSV